MARDTITSRQLIERLKSRIRLTTEDINSIEELKAGDKPPVDKAAAPKAPTK